VALFLVLERLTESLFRIPTGGGVSSAQDDYHDVFGFLGIGRFQKIGSNRPWGCGDQTRSATSAIGRKRTVKIEFLAKLRVRFAPESGRWTARLSKVC